MDFVYLVTLLLLIQYVFFAMKTGMARGKDTVVAPATSGDEKYERAFRVQMNTLEQLIIVLPAMIICALSFRADVAAILGAIFLVTRFIYAAAYMKDPKTRALGFVSGFFATIALLLCSLYGVIMQLV